MRAGSSARERGPARLPIVTAAAAGVALALTFFELASTLPPGHWWAAISGGDTSVQALVFSQLALSRVVVTWLVGAALALSGVLLQQALLNPFADVSTLGVSAGAYLALAAASLLFPSLLGAGPEWVALAGSGAAAALTLAVARVGGLSAVSVVLAGLTVTLFCGAAAALLTVLNHEYLSSLFVWQSGSLAQNGWSAATYLLPRTVLCFAMAALLLRPLSMLALDDGQARSTGMNVAAARGGAIVLATVLGAVCVSAVGVIGFLGVAAVQIVRLLGARTLRQRLVWAPAFGAALLWLTDQVVQRLAALGLDIPTGAAVGLIGAPLLLIVVSQVRGGELAPSAPTLRRSASRPKMTIVFLFGAFGVLAALAVWLGKTPWGWRWLTLDELGDAIPWRAPRMLASASAGSALAIAGLLLQRLTGNAMASPEALGISSGAALGVIVLLFFDFGLSQQSMFVSGCAGAGFALLLIMTLTRRPDVSPGRLLLVGVSLATILSAFAATLLTSGDPRSAALAAWMAGSTSRVTSEQALTAGAITIAGLAASLAGARWLAIFPLGAAFSRSLGVEQTRARLAVTTLIAALTAAATVIVGPISFIGLMAPHIVRGLGLRRPAHEILAATAIGGGLLVAADWMGRNLFFPWQAPAGLLSALIGAPLFLWLQRRRA